MIDSPDTHENLPAKRVPHESGAAETNPLETTDIQCRRALPTKLTDGEVFIFDDQSALSTVLRKLLVRSTELQTEEITTINPKDIYSKTPGSECRVQNAIAASIAPVVQAANDPERGVSLVITDFEMGAITGEKLIDALQAALGKELPFGVILNSSNPDLATQSACFRDAFMEKPFDIRILRQHLDTLFPR